MKPVVQVNLVSSQLWVELLFISYEAKYDKKKKRLSSHRGTYGVNFFELENL